MKFRLPVGVLRLAACGAVLVVTTSSAFAQQVVWTREAELNASMFFGNSSQRQGGTRASVSRADSSLEFSVGARFTYADTEDEDEIRTVNRRSWDASSALDWRPFAKVSPFVFGSVESSLEKQIDLRYGAGAGGKYTFVRDSLREHSVSVAALAERTTPRVETPDFDDDLLMRWSVRHRMHQKFANGITLSTTTFYKPRFDDLADYTISSVNSLGVSLSTLLSLTITFIDNYDSEAQVRGAASNNDGQLLLGLKAAW